jgi:hypothetical protein
MTTSSIAGEATPVEPFRYGYRWVEVQDEHGAATWTQIPLTLEDVLHPREGDFVIQSDGHIRRCRYLADVLDAHLAGDPRAAVLHDLLIHWDIPDLRSHGPDIAVVLGLRERREWESFDVAEEGVRPAFIIEVVSPSTAVHDRTTKVRHYARAGVPLYLLVDTARRRGGSAPRLLGYELTPFGYQSLAPDAQGRFRLAPLPLWLGLHDSEVALFDPAGQPLGDYGALAKALTAERVARLAAEERAAAAEARLRRLEEELRRREANGPSA